jgi:hypothetical protein
MNYSELQRELKTLVQDASPEILLMIPDAINEAVQELAYEISFPSLKSVSTVTTSTTYYYVSMPSGFNGKLLYCGTSDGECTVLHGGLAELMQLYPSLDDTGEVVHVALEGSILYYQGMPSTAETLYCLLYSNPDVLTNDTDTPSCIPEYYHREAIVYRAAVKCFNAIEDALELKSKPNTEYYTNLALAGKNKLHAWVSKRRINIGTSVWSI